jgi:AcrR family transcriptional regulator
VSDDSKSSRDRLVDAMESLLWERGYADTSPKDVLKRAQVGQGSMYHFISGKHELAVEAIRQNVRRAFGGHELLEGTGSPMDRVERCLRYPRQGVRGCRVGRMTQDPQVFDDPDMIGLIAGAFEGQLSLWEKVIRQAVDARELPAGINPSDLARTISAVIQGGYVLARAAHAQEPMDRAIEGLIGLLEAVRIDRVPDSRR